MFDKNGSDLPGIIYDLLLQNLLKKKKILNDAYPV